MIYRLLAILWLLCVPMGVLQASIVAPYNSPNLARVSDNAMSPVTIVNDMLSSTAILLGMAFIVYAGLSYRKHRMNPLEVPISQVIVLLVLGIILVCLPFLHYLTPSGVSPTISL